MSDLWPELSRLAARVPFLGPRVALRLHRLGLGVSAITWPELAGLVETERPDTLSVDVFDTCVVRDLLGDNPIELAIDRLVGVDSAGAAVTLCPTGTAADLEELLCRPVPDVAESLDRVRRAGVRVVFLSDTDRSSETVAAILSAHGILRDGDRLIVSCEAGATKSDGDLYPQTFTERSGRIWHVGNNLWSDVAMAQQAGLRAFAIVTAEPTRYEAAMAARHATAGPAVASAARAARLEIMTGGQTSAREKQIAVVGAEVAGQALGAFLLWVADRCRDEGVKQVWFLSRDGELPFEMARVMPSDHWGDAELGYLHCSRWTWLLAGASTMGLEPWLEAGTRDQTAFIHSNRHRVPLVSLLGRIGLEMADLERIQPQLAALPPWEPLPTEFGQEWEQLLAEPRVGALILARSEVRRALIEDYLLGLGMSGGRVAMIDVGWRGRLAWAISSLTRGLTGADPLHLHVGGDKVWLDADAELRIERFAFDGLAPSRPVTNPVTCVETLTASGRARVVGYERRGDGSVHPVLKREIAAVRNADRQLLWDGAVKAARALPSRALLEELECTGESLGQEANDVLSLWWTQPLRSEVEALAGLAFEGDDDGRLVEPLVTPYSAREFSGDAKRSRQWQEGSMAVSGPGVGPMVAAYKSLRKLRR